MPLTVPEGVIRFLAQHASGKTLATLDAIDDPRAIPYYVDVKIANQMAS